MVIFLFLLGAVGLGVAAWSWRMWFAMNHPEECVCSMSARCKRHQLNIEKLTAAARKGIAFRPKMRREVE